MEVHANAKLAPQGRLTMVRRLEHENWTLVQAAAAAGVSVKTAAKWRKRFRAAGEAGLIDMSSRPRRIPHETPEDRVEAIAALRRIRSTGAEIAEMLGMPISTVSLVLRRIGLGKLSRLEPPEPPNRYEKQRPGELIHIDIKKLGRISDAGAGHRMMGHGQRQSQRKRHGRGSTGWEYVHVCVDDATRLAYVEVLSDEKAVTAIGFLRRAIRHYAGFGIKVERLMTDNGSAYRSFAHAAACRALKVKHIRTRPYRPRTNGKAERFIRTMLGGWAYGAIYGSSKERTAALNGWLDFYNWKRPHGSLAKRPPGTRLAELTRNNVLGSYN
jgi:transposase InsO family protein